MNVIAVAGGTASGKTTFTELLNEFWNSCGATLLSMDRYYRCLGHLPSEERAKTNFDDPASLDCELFIEHIRALRSGKTIDAPLYDFATHSRSEKTESLRADTILILDGILLLHLEEVRALSDLSIFVDAPDSLRLQRRILRDVQERGRSEASVITQWQESVQPMFEQYVYPSMEHADIILYGHQCFKEQLEGLKENLHALTPVLM